MAAPGPTRVKSSLSSGFSIQLRRSAPFRRRIACDHELRMLGSESEERLELGVGDVVVVGLVYEDA